METKEVYKPFLRIQSLNIVEFRRGMKINTTLLLQKDKT